jgi:hypothetical protein
VYTISVRSMSADTPFSGSLPDDSAGYRRSADVVRHLAYAEASIILIDCLMSLLMQKGVLSSQELIESVETAIATKQQMVADDDHREIALVAAGVLSGLANSLASEKE